jgi:hypothetical protein
MKNLLAHGLMAACILVPALAHAEAHLVSVRDQGDCALGFLTSNIEITIDGEEHDLSFNCLFFNEQTITLGEGDTCDVTSGMCSGALPQNEVQVICNQGGFATTEIACRH